MSNLLVHIADRVLNRPLMIMPDKLALIAQVLEGRIGIDATEFKEIETSDHLRNGPEASRFVGSSVSSDGTKYKPYRVDNGVALIPVLGSLVNRGAWVGARSGMTSYEGLGFQLDQAGADPDVKSVLLDLDSPGGEAVGAFEIADKVRSLAKSKPVTAMINGMAASAAYAIASAASRIVTTASGVAGSVGVVLMHADYSNALHQKGIKPTLIHAGAHKVDGNPYEPLTSSVRADLQAEVDQFYGLFVGSVAQGRKGKMTDASVRATEARTYIGAAAVAAGLADSIGSFESVLADLSAQSGPAKKGPSSKSGLHLSDPTPAPKAETLPQPSGSTALTPVTLDASMVAAIASFGKPDAAAIAANWDAVIADINGENAEASLRPGSIDAGWNDVVAQVNGKRSAGPLDPLWAEAIQPYSRSEPRGAMTGPGADAWNDVIATINGKAPRSAKPGFGWDAVINQINKQARSGSG
jgi:signal peptide peptidase SppA